MISLGSGLDENVGQSLVNRRTRHSYAGPRCALRAGRAGIQIQQEMHLGIEKRSS